MRVQQDSDQIQVHTFHYVLTVTSACFTLCDPRTDHTLIDCPSPFIYQPQLASSSCSWTFDGWTVDASQQSPVEIVLNASCGVLDLTQTLTCFEEYVELGSKTRHVAAGDKVAHWSLLAPGTKLDMFHVHHWRNRHGHTQTYETYNLSQGQRHGENLPYSLLPEMRDQWTRLTDLTTYSTDWQFAPHPSFFLMQRDSCLLGLGARDLPTGFGLAFQSAGTKLLHLRFDNGGEHANLVPAGAEIVAPRLYLWLDHNRGIWDSVDHYVRLLCQDKETVGRDHRSAPHWWFRPQYCTWQDQCYIAKSPGFYNWMSDKPAGQSPVESFNSALLDYLLDRLEQEHLNVGSVVVDDGWQKARGEWVAHPERFPNLREQIDRIHDLGMKVLLWFAPFDFSDGSVALSMPHLLCGNGVLGSHGMPLIDYSNPRAQEEYVRPMMRYFFSSDPDCLNADGIKTDFMADKVQPVFPVYDPTWRGEERFILRSLELFYRSMKSYKPDAMHMGCSAHPMFSTVQDVIRTFDVPASQLQHRDRAIMLRHFVPGCLVSLDLSECRSLADIEQHIAIAYHYNLLYQLPRIALDPNTGKHPLGCDFFPLLRRKLTAWG